MQALEIHAHAADLSVCIGMPTGPSIPWQTAMALAATTRLCATKGIEIQVSVVAGAAIVTGARDQVVREYLKTDASRLMWIDSDIAWREGDFLRMLLLSTEMPVLCASYPRKRPDEGHTIVPFDGDTTPNKFGCYRISGTGLGFTVMRREVVEKLSAAAEPVFDEFQGEAIPAVFRVDTVMRDGRRTRRGEDMAFFSDIADLGYPVWYDPSIKLGHVGPYVFGSGR